MTAFLLVWLLAQAVSVVLVWAFTIGLGREVHLKATPPIAVIVPVKGHHEEFDRFLDHLFAQDYPHFRVIFSVEADADPAVVPIQKWRTKFPDRVTLVVAGLARDEGQKIANLRAALAHVTPADEILVFADADIRPLRDWLKRLVAPLVDGKADVATGFAWLVVNDRSFSTCVMAAMAATMVTVPRLPIFNAAWGGSVAILRERCEALDLQQAWRGSLCDDLHLTAIAQRAGYTIAVPREMLLRLYVSTRGFGEVASDALRWLVCFRIYVPATYYVVMFGLTFAAAGWIIALVGTLCGERTATAVLIGALLLAALRSSGRAAIVVRLWGWEGLKENSRFLLRDALVAPLAAILNASFGWYALFMRRITWAGTTYEILGPNQTRVLSRSPPA